jgi:hypothetical protein
MSAVVRKRAMGTMTMVMKGTASQEGWTGSNSVRKSVSRGRLTSKLALVNSTGGKSCNSG